ncbi:MAG: mandelate racemase/muconate lactonizing enzyme family protein [Solirubrobacterales bacterium]
MHVTEVETIPYALPFREPYVTARGTLERREMLLLRVHTDSGHAGLGEAVPMSLRGGDSLAAIERALGRAVRRLRRADLSDFAGEDPLAAAVDAVIHTVAGRRLPAPAAAAIEVAIFDLAGRASGLPLWRVLRAEAAEPLQCNATLVAGSPTDVAADAEGWAARGFTTFKLKLGVGDDLQQVAAVREAVGGDARIRVDANGTWSVDDAIAILDRLEPLGIELAEQPAAGLRELAAVREASTVRIAADESIASRKEAAKAVSTGACDLATVKLAKVGGMGRAAGIAAELPVYLSSALDGPIGIAAAAHAAQAIYREATDPGLAHGLATQELFASTIAARESELDGDLLRVPGALGHGVEIDEAALTDHRI